MWCCVQNCKNNTKKGTKIHGITFHMFPKDQNLRSTWIEALGKHDWEPKERSVICSKHFKQNAFYETKGGLRRIRHGAVPVLAIGSTEDLEAPAALRVCRMCLAIDVKMYHITDFNLSHFYEEFTGIIPNLEDRLPKMVCWECVGRLMSAKRFKDKALRCYSLLAEKFNKKNCMTIKDVKLINRSLHKLQSPLNMECFGDDKCDLMICEDEIINVDKEVGCEDNLSEDNLSEDNLSEDNFSEDKCDLMICKDEIIKVDKDVGCKDNLSEDNLSEDNLSEDNFSEDKCDLMICEDEIIKVDKEVGCEDYLSEDNLSEDSNGNTNDMVPVVMLQVMDDKIFREKYPGFISEDIKNLSEAYKEKNTKKRKYEVKSNKAKNVPVRISFTDDDTSLTTTEKNRIRNDWGCKEQVGVVRRRRKKRAPGVYVHWGADNLDRRKRVINCEQCGVQLDSYWMYSRHFRVVHPDLSPTKFSSVAGNCMCEQCGKMFACKARLVDHMTAHTGEKRFKCGVCGKGYTNKHSLSVHQRVHGAQVPIYQCPYCEKQFHFYQNCNRHIKTVHKGVKQFTCEICGKEFTSAWGQREHVDHVHHKKPRPKRVRVRHAPAYRDL